MPRVRRARRCTAAARPPHAARCGAPRASARRRLPSAPTARSSRARLSCGSPRAIYPDRHRLSDRAGEGAIRRTAGARRTALQPWTPSLRGQGVGLSRRLPSRGGARRQRASAVPVMARRGVGMAYSLPDDVDQRPVAIDGAGTLGRRIAAVYVAGGSDVRVFDTSGEQRRAAKEEIEQRIGEMQDVLGLHPARVGRVEVADDLRAAVDRAWMVVEAVPERLDLKTQVFGELDRLAAPDAILATNSSSLPSSAMIEEVEHPERVLNTHYQQPPELNSVELMSCGKTDGGVIDALLARI